MLKVLILFSSLVSVVVFAEEQKLRGCKFELENIEKNVTAAAMRIQLWREHEAVCSGTGLYEYQLGKYYIANREYKNAKSILEKGLSFDSGYRKELNLARANIFLHQKNYPLAAKHYRTVTQKFPEWWAGYNYLGFSLFAQGKNKEAVKYLVKSNELSEQADTYRTLTLAYYLLDEHAQAVDSLNRAFSLNEDIVADRDPMVAGIRSYADLGKYDVSRKLLAMLLQKNPSIKNDNEYLRAGFYVKEKMIADGLIEQ